MHYFVTSLLILFFNFSGFASPVDQTDGQACSQLYFVHDWQEYRWHFPSNESAPLVDSTYTLVDLLDVTHSDQIVMLLYDGVESAYSLVTADAAEPDNFVSLKNLTAPVLGLTGSPDGLRAAGAYFFRGESFLTVFDLETQQEVGNVGETGLHNYDWLNGHTLIYARDRYVETTDFEEYASVFTLPEREAVAALRVSPDDAQVALLIDRASDNRQLGILSLDSGELRRIELPGTDSHIIGWLADDTVVVQVVDDFRFQILLVDVENGTVSAPGGEFYGAFISPDAAKLALYRLNPPDEGNRNPVELYVYDEQQAVRIDTESIGVIDTEEPGDPLRLYWSPDGTQLAFAAWMNETFGLFTVDIATGAVSRLTDEASFPDRIVGWLPCD